MAEPARKRTYGISESMLWEIGDKIGNDKNLIKLGIDLNFTKREATTYSDRNIQDGKITSQGTQELLSHWKRNTPLKKQRSELRAALKSNGLADIADKYLGRSNKRKSSFEQLVRSPLKKARSETTEHVAGGSTSTDVAGTSSASGQPEAVAPVPEAVAQVPEAVAPVPGTAARKQKAVQTAKQLKGELGKEKGKLKNLKKEKKETKEKMGKLEKAQKETKEKMGRLEKEVEKKRNLIAKLEETIGKREEMERKAEIRKLKQERKQTELRITKLSGKDTPQITESKPALTKRLFSFLYS